MIIGIVSFPVLLSAALLLIFDRSFGTSFFLSDIYIAGEVLHYTKEDHLYCLSIFILFHPEVLYFIACFRNNFEVIATNSQTNFGYRAMIMSILAIAFYQQ
jgi:cytochrome c oxidase subunit 1